MKCSNSLRRLSRTAWYAVRKARLKYIIWKVGRRGNTSEKTSACCAQCATTKFITYPVKMACPRAKSSTLKDSVIRFTGRRERWPAFVIAMVWLMLVSLFLAGHLVVEGVVFLLGEMK